MKLWFRNFFALMAPALIITVESKQESLSFTVEPEPGATPPYLSRSSVILRCQVSESKSSHLKIVKYGSDTTLAENHTQHSLEYHIEELECEHIGTYICLQQSPDQSERKYVDVPVNGCEPRLCSEEDKKTDHPVKYLEEARQFSFCIISYGDLKVEKIYFDNDHNKKLSKKKYEWHDYKKPPSSLNKDVEIKVFIEQVNRSLERINNITFRFKRKAEKGYKQLDYTTDLPQTWKLASLKVTTASTPAPTTSKRDDENTTSTSPTMSKTENENETTTLMTLKTDDENMTTIALITSKEDDENMTTTALWKSTTDDENSSTMTPTMTLTTTEITTTKPTTSTTTTTTTTTPSTTTTIITTPLPTKPTTTSTTSSPSKSDNSSQTTTLQPQPSSRTERTKTSWPSSSPSSSQSSSSNIAETTSLQRLRQNDNDNESLPYIILGVVLAAVFSISCMLGILVFKYRKLLFSERVRQALAGEQHSPSQDDDYDDEEEAIYQNADAIRDSLNMNKGRYVSDQGLIYVTVDHEPRKKKPKTKREKNVIYASLDFDKSGKKTVQELTKHNKSGKRSVQESAKPDKSGKHSVKELAKRDKSGKHRAQESTKNNKKHRHKHETSKHSQEARPFIHGNHRHEYKRVQRDNGGETPRTHRVPQDHRDNFDERRRKDQKQNIGQSLQIVNEWFENRRPVEHIYANT